MEKAWLAFELFINVAQSILLSEFIIKYFKFKNEIKNKKLVFCSLAVLLFIIMTINNFFIKFYSLDAVVCAIITFVFAVLILNGNIFEKLFIVIIQYSSLAGIIFFILLILNMVIPNINSVLNMESNLIRFIIMASSLVAYFIFTRLLLLFKKKSDGIKNKQRILLISLVLITFILLHFIIESVLQELNDFQPFYTVFAIVLIFALNFIFFIFTSIINNNNKITLENALLRQVKFYEEQNASNIQKMYGETKAIRHDMKQHTQYLLAEINNIPQSENAKHQEHIGNMVLYLNKLNEELIKISTVIDTGNSALNNILNYKISAAKDLGIEIIPDIAYQISGINDIDIIILIGNLLDNAIEECAKLTSGEKKIIIKIVKGRFYLDISVKNPTSFPILENNPDLISTKQAKEFHGMGIKNIKNIVEKYDGLINYHEENNYIIAEIKLVENENAAQI